MISDKERLEKLERQVKLLKEILEELVNAPVVFNDDRLDYVELQVSKSSLADAEKILSALL